MVDEHPDSTSPYSTVPPTPVLPMYQPAPMPVIPSVARPLVVPLIAFVFLGMVLALSPGFFALGRLFRAGMHVENTISDLAALLPVLFLLPAAIGLLLWREWGRVLGLLAAGVAILSTMVRHLVTLFPLLHHLTTRMLASRDAMRYFPLVSYLTWLVSMLVFYIAVLTMLQRAEVRAALAAREKGGLHPGVPVPRNWSAWEPDVSPVMTFTGSYLLSRGIGGISIFYYLYLALMAPQELGSDGFTPWHWGLLILTAAVTLAQVACGATALSGWRWARWSALAVLGLTCVYILAGEGNSLYQTFFAPESYQAIRHISPDFFLTQGLWLSGMFLQIGALSYFLVRDGKAQHA